MYILARILKLQSNFSYMAIELRKATGFKIGLAMLSSQINNNNYNKVVQKITDKVFALPLTAS